MNKIRLNLGARSYDIILADSYRELPRHLRRLKLGPAGWVISHPSLLKRCGKELLKNLRDAGWVIQTLTIPESESSKSLSTVEQLVGKIAKHTQLRAPVLFALGGGVIGDTVGFAASIFRRGVPYVQLPTTLLSQVDSAIGGKVGVDLPGAKNMAGAFYQPRLVWNNLELLKTLPMRQRRSGLSEIIKYGVMADAGLFEFLEKNLATCLSLKPQAVRLMVERSCRIKARVVSRDEKEKGNLRAQLNFGHTLGHALEAATHYKRWTHGEAIAIGMCAASDLGVAMRCFSPQDARRVKNLIQRAGLPVRADKVNRKRIKEAILRDKKFIRGRQRWVIPRRIGQVAVTEAVLPELADAVIDRYVI